MRLFFALWPSEDARAKLAQLAAAAARDTHGKPLPAEKLHVTLAFLGEVAPDRIDAARDAADRISGTGFRLAIDRRGSFHGARVAWAGCSSVPPELERLQSELATALRASGFPLEERRYTPHVTLARRTVRDLVPAAVEPIAWNARQFTLVRSDTGKGTYTVLKDWRLGGR